MLAGLLHLVFGLLSPVTNLLSSLLGSLLGGL